MFCLKNKNRLVKKKKKIRNACKIWQIKCMLSLFLLFNITKMIKNHIHSTGQNELEGIPHDRKYQQSFGRWKADD